MVLHRCNLSINYYDRLCTTLGSDELLGIYINYKLSQNHTCSRRCHHDLALKWFLYGQCQLKWFFSLHHYSLYYSRPQSFHLVPLHQFGSNNPLAIHSQMDKISFYLYFYVKNLVGWVAFAILSSIWIFYAFNVLGHPKNYKPCNLMSTLPHIVVEWYFLSIHVILHNILDKSAGVATIALVFICLLALPFSKKHVYASSNFCLIH